MKRTSLSTATLVRYLQGEMTRSESEEAERLIADSRRAQERVAELREMMDELRRPPEWVDSVDLVAEVNARLAREGGARSPGRPGGRRTRARGWVLGGGAGAALAAAAAVALLARGAAPEPPAQAGVPGARPIAVRPKGVVPGAADPDRWVGVGLARARGGRAEAIAAGARLPRGELLVTYTNLGPDPFRYLMVFAADAAGQVRWLYPAYEVAGTDPAAIPIASGAADVPLPDLIEHDFARGRLAVCGLFTREPLAVSQVEAALGGHQPAPGERLPFAGAGQHCFDVEVQ